ncbi:biotin--acetyl-CoA-carboxylase ligase [Candidatus Moduliflexus flocculans]|uniref:Bifunctional ligase/repressor BirA n=1 Tax=Candidatus Moduliflexus flocculans TaxID=1499966 RepID=A0A0S6W1D9_9BACT|nr:biotin--acetyl-CoA-carboxylase ligase [Candidatus Moduliflexus flocculans]
MPVKALGKKFTLTNENLSINAKILDVLRSKSHAYISGEELSRELNMSRTAIWKHVNSLRDLGYRVEAITSVGYKLLSSPSLLLPLEIKNGLHTQFIGRDIHWEYEVNSTNTVALKLAEEGAPQGTVVVSEAQRQGRGRLGRTWISQAENGIYLSVILRPSFVPMKAPVLTFIAAIAVVETLETLFHLNAQIKWPNDVMIQGKKVAGILTELRAEMEGIHYMILGIGVNVNTTRFPKEFQDRVTSLSLELKEKVGRVKIVQTLLEALERWYLVALSHRSDLVFERWSELSCTLHRCVEVNLGNEIVQGVATHLGASGSLFVKLDSGQEREILAGDVTMVERV